MKFFLKKVFLKIGLIGLAYRMSYKIGFINMIPGFYIRSIPIRENGESVVPLSPSENIIISCPEEEAVLVRKTVFNKIVASSLMLPDGLKLKILYGYRSIEIQTKFWQETCEKIRQKNPNLTAQEIEKEARLLSAMPNGRGPHQTGGAVDVLIVDTNGLSLNFGTEYRGWGNKVFMHSKLITSEQKRNRETLRHIMQ